MRIAIFPVLVLSLAMTLAAQDGKRIAVIIGNDSYVNRPLKNAVNDARLMDKALQAAGFRTILRENAKKADMEEALVAMLEKLGPDDTALFYYAGHGVQIENENFLVPVDFEAATTLVRAKSLFFSMPLAIEHIKRSRVKRTILILDACRSNPVSESQALQAGLAIPLNAGNESFIAFSTSPNRVATDNPSGRNSWFTEALGDLISQRGLTIEEVFMRTGKRVKDATQEQQTPWVQSSLTSKFFFYPPADATVDTDLTALEKWMEDARRSEQREEWAEAMRLVNQVLSRRPGGALQEAAQSWLPYLTARRDAQVQFEASKFGDAAKLYSQALALDAFSMDAAFQSANSYLLNDQMDEAVTMLKTIRVRGTTAAVAKADAMLKELAAVHPAAGEELKAGARQPPPLTEVLSGLHFGTPDWEAGKRYLQKNPVDLMRAAADLAAAYPPPRVPVPEPAVVSDAGQSSSPPVNIEALHVEIVSTSESRDFKIRRTAPEAVNISAEARPNGVKLKVSTEPPGAELSVEGDAQVCQSPCILTLEAGRRVIRTRMPGYMAAIREVQVGGETAGVQINLDPEFGFLQFDGLPEATAVLVNGRPVTRSATGRLQLPVGKYAVQLVQAGKVLTRNDLEIMPLATVAVPVRQ